MEEEEEEEAKERMVVMHSAQMMITLLRVLDFSTSSSRVFAKATSKAFNFFFCERAKTEGGDHLLHVVCV